MLAQFPAKRPGCPVGELPTHQIWSRAKALGTCRVGLARRATKEQKQDQHQGRCCWICNPAADCKSAASLGDGNDVSQLHSLPYRASRRSTRWALKLTTTARGVWLPRGVSSVSS